MQQESNDEEQGKYQVAEESKRGRGRSKIIRTGQKGRKEKKEKKMYHVINKEEVDPIYPSDISGREDEEA